MMAAVWFFTGMLFAGLCLYAVYLEKHHRDHPGCDNPDHLH